MKTKLVVELNHAMTFRNMVCFLFFIHSSAKKRQMMKKKRQNNEIVTKNFTFYNAILPGIITHLNEKKIHMHTLCCLTQHLEFYWHFYSSIALIILSAVNGRVSQYAIVRRKKPNAIGITITKFELENDS